MIKRHLIIHPQDESTDFLKEIYQDLFNTIVVNYKLPKDQLCYLIENSDYIIMLGHGCENGLFDSMLESFVIDEKYCDLLRKKTCIGIWCYASRFAQKYNIPGLWSGMYISEVNEIDTVPEVKEAIRCISNDDIIADIKESNNSLTHTLNYYIDKNSPFEHIINSWTKNMDSMRPISNFNLSNIRIIK